MNPEDHTAKVQSTPFVNFLERIPPGEVRQVSDLWHWSIPKSVSSKMLLSTPDIRLYCKTDVCGGLRTFRCQSGDKLLSQKSSNEFFLLYLCSNCRRNFKTFALSLNAEDGYSGTAYKYGEKPGFGAPVPQSLLRLFGSDSKLFLKGRQCENQNLGVGAFAYYRRVVEIRKNEIFELMIQVGEQTRTSSDFFSDLKSAKNEISFSKSIDVIKHALPESFLINGHNPLSLLHQALSIGLHSKTDEECLTAAHDIRVVIVALVERMHQLKMSDRELNESVQRLASMKGD